jgi:hypothetical protein
MILEFAAIATVIALTNPDSNIAAEAGLLFPCKVIENPGARGYTVTNTRGSGSRAVRGADWSSSGNVRVEVVCDETVALRIESHLHKHYYDNFTIILFESKETR